MALPYLVHRRHRHGHGWRWSASPCGPHPIVDSSISEYWVVEANSRDEAVAKVRAMLGSRLPALGREMSQEALRRLRRLVYAMNHSGNTCWVNQQAVCQVGICAGCDIFKRSLERGSAWRRN